MSGPAPGGGASRGKRKALDAVINVVPAIDLLSCCIAFLLYTAVWTQISRLQVQQLGTGAPDAEQIDSQRSVILSLAIGEKGFALETSQGQSYEIPTLGRDPDGAVLFDMKGLAQRLKALRSEYPQTQAITVSAEDTVNYGSLVEVIDSCMGAGLLSVAVTGV